MSALPQVKRDGETYFFDAGLSQLRNVEDPNEFIDLTEVEAAEVQDEIAENSYAVRREQKRVVAKEKLFGEGVNARNSEWIAAAECPIHKKAVFIIVGAPDVSIAKNMIEGKTLICPWAQGDRETKVIPKTDFPLYKSEGWRIIGSIPKDLLKIARSHNFVARNVSVERMGKYVYASAEGKDSLNSKVIRNPKTGEVGVLSMMAEGKPMKIVTEAPTVLHMTDRRNAVVADNETKIILNSELAAYEQNGWKIMYWLNNGQVAVTKYSVTTLPSHVVSVSVSRVDKYATATYPIPEVRMFERLMEQANKQYLHTGELGRPDENIKNGLLALLVVHGGVSKTYATGFLQAVGFQNVTLSSIGEQLSRLANKGIIYTQPANFKVKPPSPTEKGSIRDTSITLQANPIKLQSHPQQIAGTKTNVETEKIMGEEAYYLDKGKRQDIIQRFNMNPTFPWWTVFQASPVLRKLNQKLVYMWIQTTSTIPRFRSRDDNLIYGPFNPGQLKKVPFNDAKNLVANNKAVALNQNAFKTTKPQVYVEPEKETPKKKKKGALDYY